MKIKFSILLVLAFVASSVAMAADISSQYGSGWNSLGNDTWVLPADLTGIGCGSENEPTCEPTGFFQINNVFAASQGEWHILDEDGVTVSDQIFWGVGPSGFLSFGFYSDPNSFPDPAPGFPLQGNLCQEDIVSGCVKSFIVPGTTLNGAPIFIQAIVASDGEAGFDPFGSGADTSDGIRFSVVVPEPGTITMIGIGLIGAALAVRRKKSA